MGYFSDHKKKNVVIIMAHPNVDGHGRAETLTSEVAGAYEHAAKYSGHHVRRFNLGELSFDPILHKGYQEIQPLEPDLVLLQDAITWADHLVIVYPNWWCTMPALLKGMFDRIWLPGFAFNRQKRKDGSHASGWKRLMRGKTAHVFVLSGSHPFFIWLQFGDYTNEIKNGILGFAGFSVTLTRFGPTDFAPPWKIHEWLRKTAKFGKLAE